MISELESEAIYDLRADGAVFMSKNADTPLHPASVLKTLTLYTARRWVRDSMLADPVQIIQDDMTEGTLALLQAGDIVTWDALFHGMMLPSGNDAARAIARLCGQLILDAEGTTGHPLERFLTEMRADATSFGWEGVIVASPAGWPDYDSRLSAKQVAELGFNMDHYSINVMGAQSYVITVTGPNARSYTVTNTTNPDGDIPLRGYVGAKTGTVGGSYQFSNLLLLWDDHLGYRHATALMHAWPQSVRFEDARAIQDHIYAGAPPIDRPSLPPVQPPEPYIPIGHPAGYKYRMDGITYDVIGIRVRTHGETIDIMN